MDTTTALQPVFRYHATTLNNKGVVLIEAGRYKDAVRCFQKASEMMIAVISPHQQQSQKKSPDRPPTQQSRCEYYNHEDDEAIPLQQLGATGKSTTIVPERPCTETPTAVDGEDTPSEPTSGGDAPSSKPLPQKRGGSERQSVRTSSLLPPFPSQQYLGRPLWIQSAGRQRETPPPLDASSLSATILYNLGLAFNMMAADVTRTKYEAHQFYNLALDFYKRSSQIMLRRPMAYAILHFPVVVVTMHNLIQVHTLMEEPKAACSYHSELVNILRLMAGSQLSRGAPNFYEAFLIKFLSLPKTGVMAAAA